MKTILSNLQLCSYRWPYPDKQNVLWTMLRPKRSLFQRRKALGKICFLLGHKVPSGTVTVREAMGYLARLQHSGLVPVANWLHPIVAGLRLLLTTQANVCGWDTRVSQTTGKKLEQLKNALHTLGNPMRGPWV